MSCVEGILAGEGGTNLSRLLLKTPVSVIEAVHVRFEAFVIINKDLKFASDDFHIVGIGGFQTLFSTSNFFSIPFTCCLE